MTILNETPEKFHNYKTKMYVLVKYNEYQGEKIDQHDNMRDFIAWAKKNDTQKEIVKIEDNNDKTYTLQTKQYIATNMPQTQTMQCNQEELIKQIYKIIFNATVTLANAKPIIPIIQSMKNDTVQYIVMYNTIPPYLQNIESNIQYINKIENPSTYIQKIKTYTTRIEKLMDIVKKQ